MSLQKASVLSKKRFVEELKRLTDELSFEIQRLGDAYKYAKVEVEDAVNANVWAELYDALYQVKDVHMELEEKGGDPKMIEGAQLLENLIEDAKGVVAEYDAWRFDVVPKNIEKNIYKAVIPEDSVEFLRKDIEELSKTIGRKCGFSIPHKNDVTVSELLNDVSNCIHVYAEELMKRGNVDLESIPYTEGIVKATKDADKDILEIAVMWYFARNQGITMTLYSSIDVDETHAYVVDGRAYFRVGSSEGHATVVEKKDNELLFRYYDRDTEVNEAVASIMMKKGDCECDELEDGVKCKCKLTPRTKKATAITMALATSMDLRMNDGEDLASQLQHYKEIEEYLNRPHVKEDIEKVVNSWYR